MMKPDDATSDVMFALTKADLGKMPPELRVATGHNEDVMLFLLRVRDPDTTTHLLSGLVNFSEANSLVKILRSTRGLLGKRFDIDAAWRIRNQLESVGADIEFVRPIDIGELS